MKRTFIISAIAGLLSTGFINAVYAQSGDEQGLEVPSKTQLPQDKEAIERAKNGWWTAANKNYADRMAWFKDAKFGCFIHWGVYSEAAGRWHGKQWGGYSEHLMRKAKIPLKDYKKELVEPFNPVKFNADEWMRHAKDAGMKYFIITSKHHDGFAMYHSDAYPYDMRLTKWGKDPMAELRKAARKYGIKFGFYYSHAFDWEHPDAPGNDWDYDNPGGDKLLGTATWWTGDRKTFLPNAEKYVFEKSIPQIQELVRKYDPDILWFDTPSKLPLYLNIRILEAIREVDKENKIVVNGRLVRFGNQNMGDYRNTGDRAAFFFPTKGQWEAIPTTNDSYGYSVVDTIRKPVDHFVRLICSATAKGGNILMNVGPMGNGAWDDRDVAIFEGIGKWLKANGDAVYGAKATDLPVQQWGVTTEKDGILYIHVYNLPKDGKVVIGGLKSDIAKAWAISYPDAKITFRRLNENDVELTLPAKPLDKINTVIALSLKKRLPANPVRLLDPKDDNVLYTFDAELKGSGLGYGDGKVNKNYVRNWKNNNQSMMWTFRLNEPATYEMYIDYNTMQRDDKGTVVVTIAGKTFEVPYKPFYERQGSNSLHICRISLPQGTSTCVLSGKEHNNKEFMRPIGIRLVKAPMTRVYDGKKLAAVKAKINTPAYQPAYKKLISDADKMLQRPLVSVMDKDITAASGNKHDYISFGPYWWPDPTKKDGLPYIRKDGVRNPNGTLDRKNIGSTIGAIITLGTAYYFSDNEQYAAKAADFVRTWFINPATKMNPNMQYAQVIPGRNNGMGRGAGMIDVYSFTEMLDAVEMLTTSKAFTNDDLVGLKKWFKDYISWIQTSKVAAEENKAQNNHGLAFDVQLADYALFTGDYNLARKIISEYPARRLFTQIEPDGRQPRELARTTGFGYSVFNITHMLDMCALCHSLGIEMFGATTADGRNTANALSYISTFLGKKQEDFPYKQIKDWSKDMQTLCWQLRRAGYYDSSKDWQAMGAKYLKASPSDRRNLLYSLEK